MTEPITLADKLDRMIRELNAVVTAANKSRDFSIGALAQNAIAELGKLRKGHGADSDNEWSEWIAWPPQPYPKDYDGDGGGNGLMDVYDLQRYKERRAKSPLNQGVNSDGK